MTRLGSKKRWGTVRYAAFFECIAELGTIPGKAVAFAMSFTAKLDWSKIGKCFKINSALLVGA